MLLSQEERLFHRDERYPHTHGYVPAPSEEVRLRLTDLGNPTNPLGQVRGNDEARKRLCLAAFTALDRYNHVCNDVAFLLTGPKGAHKQEIARRFAELLRLPFIEINPATVRTAHDIFIEMGNALQRAKLPLVECKGPGRYVLPPSVIFLDDCDGLKQKPQVWTALLQAVAITDPALRTEQGVLVKTIHATWLLATTNRADVVDGLPDRFTELALAPVSASASHLASTDLDQKYQAAPRPDLSSLRAKRAELEKRGILGPPTQAWLKESGDVNPPLPSAENLKRWKDSSHPRAWVEAHKGAWSHADWLSLVEELKKSEYWPLDLVSVGQVLEGLKQAYHTERRSPALSPDQRGQPTGAKREKQREPVAAQRKSNVSRPASQPAPPSPSPAIAPEPAEWYCFSGGQQYGPVTWTQLRQWASAGNLSPADRVCKAGSAKWVLATAVYGLVPETAALEHQIVEFTRANEFDKAIAVANELVQRHPARGRAYFLRGLLHSISQLHSRALADFKEAVRLDPSNVEFRNRLLVAEKDQTAKAHGGFWKGVANAFLGICDVGQALATGTVTCPHCMRSIDVFASVCPYCTKDVFLPRF